MSLAKEAFMQSQIGQDTVQAAMDETTVVREEETQAFCDYNAEAVFRQ